MATTTNTEQIQNLIGSNQCAFDVTHHKDHGWIVETAYCPMSGDVSRFIACASKTEAQKTAARLTLRGLEPVTGSVCGLSEDDLRAMQL